MLRQETNRLDSEEKAVIASERDLTLSQTTTFRSTNFFMLSPKQATLLICLEETGWLVVHCCAKQPAGESAKVGV
jgi:hypothetical protein